ncbi:hypothetical protein [Dactylosporangium sp. CA-092794]|uniref:hypothetical protein n=1 Tax=Dactylosporangium sp. CA-092794 TaxID=3239929 RepID=UPI003D8C87D1
MRDGRIVAQGRPGEIISADLVAEVFGLRCEIIDDPQTGTPMVVPMHRHHRRVPPRAELTGASDDSHGARPTAPTR